MQIKTLFKDQRFVLKAPAVMPRIHNQICTSAAVCAPTPLSLLHQSRVALSCCFAPQLASGTSSTENLSKLLLGHLRQGKRSGGSASQRIMFSEHLQREFCMQVSCSRSACGNLPWSPSLNLATQNLSVLLSGHNNLFPKEGEKET